MTRDYITLFVRVALLLAPSISVQAQAVKGETPSSVVVSAPGKRVVFPALEEDETRYWDKGFLISIQHRASKTQPAVVLYDSAGSARQKANVWIDNAVEVMVTHAAATESGNLIVSGAAKDPTGKIAYFLATIDSSGNPAKLLRTNPFVPQQICGGENGTVWALGFDRDVDEGRTGSDYALLRKYSLDTGFVTETFQRSKLARAGRVYPMGSTMRCNSSQIGIYTGLDHEWAKYDVKSKVLRIWKAPELASVGRKITGLAFSGDGELFASIMDQAEGTSGLYKFVSRNTGDGEWSAVESTVKPFEHSAVAVLMGSTRDTMIYESSLQERDSNDKQTLSFARFTKVGSGRATAPAH